MKRTFFLFVLMCLSSNSFADALSAARANVQLVVDGISYSCQPIGGGGGQPPGDGGSGVNLCRCKLVEHSNIDHDYILQKFRKSDQTFMDLASYSRSDTNRGLEDAANCAEAKRTDPRCFLE